MSEMENHMSDHVSQNEETRSCVKMKKPHHVRKWRKIICQKMEKKDKAKKWSNHMCQKMENLHVSEK